LPFDRKILPNQELTIKVSGRKKVNIGVDAIVVESDPIDEIKIAPSAESFSLLFHKDLDFATKRILLAEKKLHN